MVEQGIGQDLRPALTFPGWRRDGDRQRRLARSTPAEEAEQANSYGWSKHHPALPLYTEDDVDRALRLITPVDPGQVVGIAPGIALTLHHAGMPPAAGCCTICGICSRIRATPS